MASSLNDIDSGLIEVGSHLRLVPAATIYGANASGKSNVISALNWMRSAVLYSHSKGEPGGPVPRTPFALDPGAREAPTRCEIDFIVEGVRHAYGFEATGTAFAAEWLHSYPNDRRMSLFDRRDMRFDFGRGLKGRNRVIADLTRPNSLFLSAAAQNGHDGLAKIAEFFREVQIIEESHGGASSAVFDQEEPRIDSRVIAMLGSLSGGISGYNVRKSELSGKSREIYQEFMAIVRRHGGDVPEDLLPGEISYTLQLSHPGHNGEMVHFDFGDESDGTRRLFALLVPMFRALDAGSVVVIDELSASLHTQASAALLALFSSPATNPKGAQLIATTHDTNLLQPPFLRRDQIWFTEKDRMGATHLYPLTDIRTRNGDNIERGYLQGRYGAIPFAGSAGGLTAVD